MSFVTGIVFPNLGSGNDATDLANVIKEATANGNKLLGYAIVQNPLVDVSTTKDPQGMTVYNGLNSALWGAGYGYLPFIEVEYGMDGGLSDITSTPKPLDLTVKGVAPARVKYLSLSKLRDSLPRLEKSRSICAPDELESDSCEDFGEG